MGGAAQSRGFSPLPVARETRAIIGVGRAGAWAPKEAEGDREPLLPAARRRRRQDDDAPAIRRRQPGIRDASDPRLRRRETPAPEL